jgi:RNA polymerase sigma-54 factor
MYRRWRTLKRVAELIVDYQREFLEKGVRFYARSPALK